ncbi:unnamed protein product [Hermetia illucens]|uniref:Uncharacterized protein n=1 Tax=Hermetia illucens TaxID=343691 RepID=A0A7R8YWF2_HERIL|nr:unnamed protein product [Hermetia illucens]
MSTHHSQEEKLADHTPRRDVINKYKQQIIIPAINGRGGLITKFNVKITIDREKLQNENQANNYLRSRLKPGVIGVDNQLDGNDYNSLQQILINNFDIKQMKFMKVMQLLNEPKPSEDQLLSYIKQYHEGETRHTGVNDDYEGIKRLYYYPNLK